MMYVFEIVTDYVGPGSNWPISKLANFAAIPPPLLQKIKSGCEVCHTRLLSAIWDEHFPYIKNKGRLYRAAVNKLPWTVLLNPNDPYNRVAMIKHMRGA